MKRWLVGLFAAGLCAASAWAADCALETAPEGIGAGNPAAPGQEAVSTGRKAISAPRGAARQMTIYVINLGRQSDDDGDSDELEFGDAILVESGGEYVLMDTGAAYTRDSVVDYLRAVGVTRLAGLYLSHLHSDHMGNYDAILGEFQVDRVYLPDTSIGGEYVSVATSTPIGTIYHSLAQKAGWNGAEVEYLGKGSTFSFGTISAKVLGPVGNHKLSDFKADKYGSQTGHYLNNCSLSAMLTCGNTTFLTCGDIEQEEEAALLAEYGKALKADMFKLDHHGLLSSNSEKFTDAVRPVFSFLPNNGYEGTTTANGSTVTKHHTIIERMQKYGIPYMLGNEGKPVIYKVVDDSISMYRDKNGNGKADDSELFKDGWNSVKGISMTSKGAYNGSDKYYFVDGKPVGGIRKIDGKWYHFADGGALQKGLYKLENGKWVFSGYRRYGENLRYYYPDGTVAIGFSTITNKGQTHLFYFDDDGFRVNGDAKWTPVEIKGKKYALNENGVVFNNNGQGGLKAYGKKYRYFSKKGVMATEWKTLNGIKYYFDPTNGYRCTGLVEIGESTYYFNGSGKLVTNKTVTVDGKTVKLDKNGKVTSPTVGTVKEVKATSKDAKNTVKWKKTSGAKGYVVYRATKKAGTYKVVKTVTDGATVKFTDKKVTVGKKYYYKVCAYKTITKVKIKGKPSAVVSVTVAKASAAKSAAAKAVAKRAPAAAPATVGDDLERTATYTVASKTEVTESGDVPDGSSATYAQTANNLYQITSKDTSTLTLKGYEGATVTGLTLSMKSNASKGAGSLSVTCGDAVIASIADSKFNSTNWHGAWSGSYYVDVTPAVTPTLVDGDIVLVIKGSENSLYCQSVAVTYETGSAMFSVVLDPAEDFKVLEGTGATVTATARNASGEVTYAWTVDGAPAGTDGPELALTTDTVGGPYEVVCVATDGGAEGMTAEASVKYTVVAAPQAYTVTVADGIENGSVAVWDGETELASPADVLEGTELKVVATPATRSYKVESLSVTGEESGEIALENGEFAMPSENVFVTATFVARSGDLFEQITGVDELEAGEYVITGAGTDGNEYAMLNEASTTTSSDYIKRLDDPVDAENGVIADPDDSIIWTLAATDGGWTIYNADAGYVCYVPNMGNSANVEAEPSVRSTWIIEATEEGLFAVANVGDSARVLRYNASNPRFACYDKPTSGKSLAFYKKSGPGVFSVKLDPAEDFEVPEGEGATITATAKNAKGEVVYEWNVTQDDTPGSAEGNVWTIQADAPAGGPWTVYCTAKDGEDEAEASVSFSIMGAPMVYEVTVDEGIENGDVSVDPASGVAGTVIVVTALPDEGYRCERIYVNGDPIEGNTFELPEGGATVGAVFVASSTKTATYTVVGKTEVETTGEVPEESEATFECNGNTATQLTGSTHMTLTLKGYEGATITGLTLRMKSNKSAGAGSLEAVCGDAVIAAIADSRFTEESWYGSWSQSYVDITPAVTPTVVDGDVVITISASANSIYCESFTVEYEPGTPVFSVALDPAEDFEVIQDEEASITATAKNAVGEVSYAWTVDGVAAETDGPVLALSTGEVSETQHVVVCVATDTGAEGVTAEATVAYTVVRAPVPYAVTIADGIENGSVSLELDGTPIETPIDLLEGTEVTVIATPDDGFALEAILVNGEPIDGDTFTVVGATEVSATFAEVVDYATLPFLAEGTPFTGPWQNPDAAGVTSEGLGTDYTSGDGRGAKFDSAGDWVQVKFAGTPETLSYALKGNETSAACVFVVQESATGAEEDWTTFATYPSEENPLSKTMAGFTNELSAESRYVRFLYETKAVGNVALYDLYISTADFSVALDLEDGTEFEQDAAASVTATARHAAGEVTYAWTVDGVAAGTDGPVLALPTTVLGPHEVVCVATDAGADGATAKASATYTVVPPKPTYAVVIADGILNGYVVADVEEAREGDTVTLTASPEPGYKLGTLTVSYGEETLEFTSSPAEFAMPAMEVLVTASFVERGEAFVRVMSLDGLEEGEYVITGAAPDGEYAMLAQLATSGTPHIMQSEAPMAVEVDTIEGPAASIVWTLAKTDDGWTIHNDAVGFVGYLAGGNSAGAEEEASAKSTWTISESDGLFLLTNVGNSSYRLLYNVGSTRFACYASELSSNIKMLALYKKSGPAVFTVDLDKTGFEVRQGTPDSVTATAKNGAEPYSYVWTSETPELNGTGPELAIPGTLVPGPYSATVTATDSSAEPQTASAVVEFTVVELPPVYTVTVAEGIENGTVTVDKTEAEEGETVTVTATPAENYRLEAILVNGEPIEGNTFDIAGDSVVSATFAEIVKYPVTIDDAIEHGTIAADKAEAEAGETVTLSCEPDDGWQLETYLLGGEPIEGNTFEMPEGEAVVSAVFAETVLVTYVPVGSGADFVVGEEYLIVAHKDGGFTSALKNVNSGLHIGVDEVVIAGDGSITTDNDAIVWEIRAGAVEGQYVLYNASAGVFAAAVSDRNTAQVLEDGTKPLAQWTIDLSEAPAVKIASVEYPGRWLQRNNVANNKYFAAYRGTETTPALYKKAGPPVFSVGFDKEDGFTVAQGTADSITAEAANGTEPYAYAWTGDLTGEGAVLEIPATLEAGEYTVAVTATDSSDEPQTATAEVSFKVVAKYAVTVADGIVGGEVAVDKALAEAGETVTVTATAASGYELIAITVDGEPIEGDTFEMPAKDVVVSATFAEVVDYAVLPFIEKDTPYPGPWKTAEIAGLTHNGFDGDYKDGSAKFTTAGTWMQIKFQGTPGTLSFGIKGNGTGAGSVSTFAVLESADGETWTDVAVFASDDNLTTSRQDVGFALAEDSRYIQFLYREKGDGNVGIYDVYISAAGEDEPAVTVTGETTLALGGTFELALALENYTGGYAWAWEPETIGYVDPDTATFWWTPTKAGETAVTFSAKDGDRTIASATVTLTVVEPEPEVVIDGEDSGKTGHPVSFSVTAGIPGGTIDFSNFLYNFPEDSKLTEDDVTIDEVTGDVSFTPDVPGDYEFGFALVGSQELAVWTVTVEGEEPPSELPEITGMQFDTDEGTIVLEFKGTASAVWATDELEDADSWAAVEGAVIDGNTATVPMVPMDKQFLRVQ